MSVFSYIFKILLPPYCLLSLILLPQSLVEVRDADATQPKTMQFPRCPLSFLRPFSSYNYFSVINQILWAPDDKKILTISSRHSVRPYCSLSLSLLAAALLSSQRGLGSWGSKRRNETQRIAHARIHEQTSPNFLLPFLGNNYFLAIS